MPNIKALIAEDHRMFRMAIRNHLMDYNIDIVGEASNGLELLELLKSHQVDVVLMDIEMDGMDGGTALDIVIKEYPLQKVIMLSQYDDSLLMQNFISRGAVAFVNKSETIDKLVEVIETIMFSEHALGSVHDNTFTRREMEIIPYLCEGLTNEEIAEKLNVVSKTVEAHRYRLFSKLGAKKLCDFLKTAFQKGFQFIK